MKTRHYLMAVLAFVMALCLGVVFMPTQNTAEAAVAFGTEIVTDGDFENLGVQEGTPVVLESAPGVGNFTGFGLLGDAMAKHGEFVNEDGNTYFKLGAGYKGFTGNDYVLHVKSASFEAMGEGTYTVSVDIKPSATVIAKTFYLRVMGGPAELYVNYVVPFQAPDALDATAAQEGWDATVANMTALANGWYRYTCTMEFVADQLPGHNLWIMAGIKDATADDYFCIDNLSMKVGGPEIVTDGDFENLGVEAGTPVVLESAPGVGNFTGFGLLGNEMAKHGEFVNEDGNTYFKLGAGYKGFTGNDYVLHVKSASFEVMGEGIYKVAVDIKPSASVIAKTFYLRVMGGPAELYVNYVVPFQDPNALDAPAAQEGWDATAANMTDLGNGWYRYVCEMEFVADQLPGHNLWIMAGIKDATADDYFCIDNLSMRKVGEKKESAGVEIGTELFEYGDFEEQIADGEESATLDGNVNGIVGFGPSGEYVKDATGNTYLKLGMDYQGAVQNDNGANVAVQVTGLNFNKLGQGIYTFEFDIAAFGEFTKTKYLRTMLQPNDHNMVYLNEFVPETWGQAEWLNGKGEVYAKLEAIEGKDGWFHFTQEMEVSENMNNSGCTMVWIMLGLYEGTENDYYAIDNMSFKRTGDVSGEITDDSVAIPEEDQVELMPDLATVLGENGEQWYCDGTSERNGFGSYAGQSLGYYYKEGDETILKMCYNEGTTLENQWGINIAGYWKNDFMNTGAGYYKFSFDIKANGEMVKNTWYLRSFITPPGENSVASLIPMGTLNAEEDWAATVKNMEDLGDGWYRYTRTFKVSTASGNIEADRVIFQMGYNPNSTDRAETDFYLFKNFSLIKTREIPESRPSLKGDNTATFDYNAAADVSFEVNLNGNDIDLVKSVTKGVDEKSIGKANFAYNEETSMLTIKKEYLSTLKNGEWTFTMVTLGGNVVMKINVVNATEAPVASDSTTTNEGSACGGAMGVSSIMAIALLAGVAMVKKSKEN